METYLSSSSQNTKSPLLSFCLFALEVMKRAFQKHQTKAVASNEKKRILFAFFGQGFFTGFLARFHSSFHIFMIPPNLTKMWVFFITNMVFDLRFEYHKKLHKSKFNVCVTETGLLSLFFCKNFSKCSKTKQKYYHPLSQYIQYQQNAESTHIHIYIHGEKLAALPWDLILMKLKKRRLTRVIRRGAEL